MQKEITSWEKLEEAVLRVGMLPYFINKIPGFSVEENVPEEQLWDITDGPWDWKGTVIRNLRAAYGKFFNSRAGYISLEYLPDFLNVRRANSKLEAGGEEERIYKILVENESLLSRELKTLSGYVMPRKPRRSANPFENMETLDSPKKPKLTDSRFESAISRLQMSGYVVIADFEYLYDRHGNRYGWGLARYTTPEALYEIVPARCDPEESFQRLFERLRKFLPDADPARIARLII